MKTKSALMKHLGWVPFGLERGARKLFFWVLEPSDRATKVRRFWITVGVPVVFILLTASQPLVSILGSFFLLLCASAWFGYVEEREMVIREEEYQLPYDIDGEPMTGGEVLRALIDAHPGEGVEALAERLSHRPGHPEVSAEDLARDMAAWGIRTPRQKTLEEAPPPPLPDTPSEPEAELSPATTLTKEEPLEETMGEDTGFGNPVAIASDHAEAEENSEEAPGDSGPVSVPGGPAAEDSEAHQVDVHDDDPGEDVRGD